MEAPKVSVIVPVKNDGKKIGNCIHALLNQSLAPYEIIVVDGHSTDTTVQVVKQFPVRLIFEDYGSIGGGRQTGVENATGDFVAFTDSDCIPDTAWLENLVRGLGDGIAGVGGGIRNIGRGLWEESIGLALNTFLGSANSVQDRMFTDRRYVKSISGCNCIYRREDLVRVGGYDTRLSLNEDTEINQRLLKYGKLLYVPDAIVAHDQDRDLKEFSRRMYRFGYGRGKNKLIDLQVVPPIMAVAVIALLFISPLLSVFMVGIYVLILLSFDAWIFYRTRKWPYLASIPVIFIAEHLFYTIGFWHGMIKIWD